MKPYKPQQYETPDKLSTVITRFVFSVLFYPMTIVKKYNNYNIRVGEMVNELKDNDLDRIRKNNASLVMRFLYLPLFAGLAVSGYFTYNHIEDYQRYKAKIVRPLPDDGFGSSVGNLIKKTKIIIKENPIKKNDYFFLLYGYLVCLVGSKFLSLNPSFREEQRITLIFASLGHTDTEGKPWKITWTPDAIMIDAFHCDPAQLCANNRFWSSVNFPPGMPKVFKSNMNKFIVQRAYELPSTIIFSFEELK